MDGTDIRPKLRLTLSSQGYKIVGGEDGGALCEDLRLSDIAGLEKTLNLHAGPLDRSIDGANHTYSVADRESCHAVFTRHLPALEQSVVKAVAELETGTEKFHERNGGESERGRQKSITQQRVLKKETAMCAVRVCKQALTCLGSTNLLTSMDLHTSLEALKTVVLALATASTHYAAVFLSDPSNTLVVPVARVFYAKMDNAACAKLLDGVSARVLELSKGTVVVGAQTFDGAQRLNRTNTLQAMAGEAVQFCDELVSGSDVEGQSMEAKATRTLTLSEYIIASMQQFPPRPPVLRGLFRAQLRRPENSALLIQATARAVVADDVPACTTAPWMDGGDEWEEGGEEWVECGEEAVDEGDQQDADGDGGWTGRAAGIIDRRWQLFRSPAVTRQSSPPKSKILPSSTSEFMRRLSELNSAFPHELVYTDSIPMGPLESRPSEVGKSFLPVSVVLQLATVEQVRQHTEVYLRACEVLKSAVASGTTPLSKRDVAVLRQLLPASDSTKKKRLSKLEVIAVLVDLGRAPGASAELRTLAEIHAAESIGFHPQLSVPQLRRFAANARLARLQDPARCKGSTSRPPPSGGAMHMYDPYHLFHNVVTRVVFGENGDKDVLNRDELLDAAKALRGGVGDPVLISGLKGTVDKHSHAFSFTLLTNEELVGELRRRNRLKAAVVLDILGRAANAWTKPHLTNQQRTLDLHLCSLLVFRFFGRSIRDVGALRSTKAVGGILTNQLMDLLANNEVREAFQALIPPGVLKETALSTRALETSFSQICGSGRNSILMGKPLQFGPSANGPVGSGSEPSQPLAPSCTRDACRLYDARFVRADLSSWERACRLAGLYR